MLNCTSAGGGACQLTYNVGMSLVSGKDWRDVNNAASVRTIAGLCVAFIQKHLYIFFSSAFQNKFYIETKLNRDLRNDLIKLFTEHVAEKHIYSLMRK